VFPLGFGHVNGNCCECSSEQGLNTLVINCDYICSEVGTAANEFTVAHRAAVVVCPADSFSVQVPVKLSATKPSTLTEVSHGIPQSFHRSGYIVQCLK
jgi:hypothetical protein